MTLTPPVAGLVLQYAPSVDPAGMDTDERAVFEVTDSASSFEESAC